MLPKELLEVRKSKGKIFPKFAGNNDYTLAEKIIKIFRRGKGRKYGEVLAAIKTLENAKNYRKVRAFSRVMERFCIEKACIFDVSSAIEPQKVRMFLFERGYVTSKKERQRIIEYAARFFNTTPEEIERAMYADRDEELVLVDVRQMTPELLIKLYNLSLLQTAVFDCLRLSFSVSSNHKEIFRRIKWLGLMYEIQDSIEITGAASILKMTRRYGTSIAKLIPSIIKAEKWWIKAEIIDKERIYFFEIDDSSKHLFPDYDEKIEYDSSLEEEFARKIKTIKPEVEIVREPEVIKTGDYAFIPDFLIK
ncbi:translation initiation factor IF-2, partial [Archaeoglobales archaeon]